MTSVWDELCDWYIEMAKVRLWKAEEDPKAANDALWTLRTALTEGLKLLHPVYAVYHRGNLLHTSS